MVLSHIKDLEVGNQEWCGGFSVIRHAVSFSLPVSRATALSKITAQLLAFMFMFQPIKRKKGIYTPSKGIVHNYMQLAAHI